jgi:predicted small integral membrane protein
MGVPMTTRYLKIVFVALISLLCLFYGTQNVVNLDACYQAFAYVLGAVDHQIYSHQVIPAIQSPAVIWLALAIVVGLEFTGGLCAAKGAWDLWNARKASAEDFNGAKTYALIGCGLGIVVWLGLFAVFGGALFIMWQTDAGRASLEGAFQFFGACALIFMIVSAADD